jgi:hypothetical protein
MSGERNIIRVRTIILINPDDGPPREVEIYSQADDVMKDFAANLVQGRRLNVSVIVVFTDLFAWASSLSVSLEDATAEHFVQRAIQADWELSAGVRPAWWPNHQEAARTWDVHYRGDPEHQEAAELARMRLERYDLQPLVLSDLPPRWNPDAATLELALPAGVPTGPQSGGVSYMRSRSCNGG